MQHLFSSKPGLYALIILFFLITAVSAAEQHGLVSIEDYYSNDSSSAYDFHFLATRVRLDANKLNKAGTLSFHFDGRERNNLGSRDYNSNIKNERIDTLNLEYTGFKNLYLAVGRLWPRELATERVDGLNLLHQMGNLSIGFFGGLKPDPYTEGLDSDFTTAGGYILYRKEYLQANLAFTHNGFKGNIDRQYIYGQCSYSPLKEIRLYGSITTDINQITDDIQLTNAVVELSYRPDFRKGLVFGYNQFRAYHLYSSMTFDIDQSLQQLYYIRGDYRFRDRYTLYGRYELQTLHYNAFERDLQSSNTYQIGFRNDNLMNLHINMDVNATLTDSFSSSYNTYNIQASRFFSDEFQLTFNGSYMQSQYDTSDYTDDIITYGISGYFNLKRRWDMSVSYEGRQARNYSTHTLMSRISYRF